MSCDKLVFDLSQEIEGSPNVFIRKDWLNILDNQNQSYQANQSIIDTSQLSNSNKYMSYREAYLSVPLLLTVVAPPTASSTYSIGDYSIGLKNWFGSVIHSFTLDYNGTTIIQQTPFCNMWNSFKLMTTLSWADVATQGATIGFYPDTAGAWTYQTAASSNGKGVANNDLSLISTPSSFSYLINSYNQYDSTTKFGGNVGLYKRIQWITYDLTSGGEKSVASYGTNGVALGSMQQIWKSYISQDVPGTTTQSGLFQVSVMATIYLKHIHSFFNMVPLLKGAFMKMTMNLNNASTTLTLATNLISSESSIVSVGGVNPIMIPSVNTGSSWMVAPVPASSTIYYNLSVGAKLLDNSIISNTTGSYKPGDGALSKSIYLYVPAYTFNPVFEQAYLSSPVKQIKYTDIYQYQVTTSIASGAQFNNLITNGIANIKSVLIIPFYKQNSAGADYNEYQSAIDPAGTGTTAPMVTLGNFNVQISGQNAIYNMQRYTFEQFNNQLYGQNAVNGGLTDGLTSGLIDFMDFQNSYCYYYVNVERMLPVEQSVPKSVQILGTNYSTSPLQLWVFVEYGVEVSIDILTGARV